MAITYVMSACNNPHPFKIGDKRKGSMHFYRHNLDDRKKYFDQSTVDAWIEVLSPVYVGSLELFYESSTRLEPKDVNPGNPSSSKIT